jgi:hypothetical protein
MIGKGAKYLTAAGFGRYRITAASLDSNLMFVGSFWLNGSAIQAIMDAFGADGTAVIAATNEYLNGIAAQGQAGKAKATALAGFINEDPMMVCSLGLEPQGVTMPVRWLVGDGASYIIVSGFAINSVNKYTMRCSLVYEESDFIGSTGRSCIMQWTDHILYTYDTGSYTSNGSYSETNDAIVEYGKTIISVNGDTRSAPKNYGNDSSNLQIYWAGRYGKATNRFAYVEGDDLIRLIPYKHPTQGNGMLDLVNVVFYPNAGTGQFTIPDISYTPTP